MIQCHADFKHVSRLLSWLYDERDHFIICIDANSVEDRACLDWALAKKNVSYIRYHAITWGGPSMMAAMLSCIRKAIDIPHWEYFINLSGQDLPLVSREALREKLAEYKVNGYVNFIADFGRLKFEPIVAADHFVDRRRLLRGPSGALIELFGSVCDLAEEDANEHYQFRPVVTPELRPTFIVNEAVQGRLIHCRPYFQFEAELTTRFFERIPYRFGRQWVVAGRRFCQFVAESELAADVYAVLARSFIPDEAFFQTVAAVAPIDLVGGTLGDNLRYGLGGPENISDENFEQALASGSIFARKLDLARSERALHWADKQFQGHKPE